MKGYYQKRIHQLETELERRQREIARNARPGKKQSGISMSFCAIWEDMPLSGPGTWADRMERWSVTWTRDAGSCV